MNETRMALPAEVDVLKLTARVNELEHQVEVLKSQVNAVTAWEDKLYVFEDLKPLINPNLFEDVYVEKQL